MPSPSLQSNQNNNGSSSSITCAFTNAQTFGNTNVICFTAASFADLTVQSITDTVGNIYTLVPNTLINGGGGGAPWMWIYTCVGIKTASAGNTVSVSLANGSFDQPFIIMISEEPTSTGIRIGNSASTTFSGNNASVSLAGTIVGDYCVGFTYSFGGSTGASAGNIGINAANLL